MIGRVAQDVKVSQPDFDDCCAEGFGVINWALEIDMNTSSTAPRYAVAAMLSRSRVWSLAERAHAMFTARLPIAAFAALCLTIGCSDPREPLCLRQTCEERYRWTLVPIGEICVRQKQIRTVCVCHEVYVPGEPLPESEGTR